MNKFFTILTLFLVCTASVLAQINVNAPQRVAVGEQFRLQYTMQTTDVKGFRTGNIPDAFEVLMGPSTSTQQSFQMINGHTTSSSSVTYTYILSAEKNGTFTIPAARARVDGKDAVSSAIKITVSGKAQNAQSQQGGGMQQQRGAQVRPSGSHISGNDLFIKVSANKQRVHEQEPILLTYKVYTQVELTQLEGKMPDLTGFHTQEVPLPQQKSFHLESINGRPYRCVTWSQYVMYPQMTGKLEIPSITFKGIVVQENLNVDPFEAFFNGGSGYVEMKKDIKAPGMTIQVDPLPEKPAGFSGGVGHFSISATQDNQKVKAGDPVNIRVVVSGNGNLKLIKQPEISVPKDFEKYDAKVTDKTKLTEQGLTGSMIYDFLIVPRNQGNYTIPAIEFTYFDTSSNAYKTIRTSPMKLEVEKGDGRKGDVTDYSQKEDKDIHPIHETGIKLYDSNRYFFGSKVYMILNALALVAFIALVIIFRKRAMEMANVALVRGKKANKVAGKRLKKAARLMSQGKASEFYDEVLRALWGYVSDKLSMPVSELTRENIAERLTFRNVDNDIIDSFIEALDECEFERYAPGDAAGNMQKTYDKAVSAITNIEEGMKIRKKTMQSSASTLGALLLIIASFSFSSLHAQNDKAMIKADTDDTRKETAYNKVTEANVAYQKGNYQDAIRLYNESLIKYQSADVYYNLGNSYFRSDDITHAVISYRRALLLSPGNKDIIHNLTIAQSKTIDKVPVSDEMFFVSWFRSLLGIMSIDAWAYMALVSLVISLLLFLAYLFAENMLIRKISFYVSVALIVLFLIGNIFAWMMKDNVQNSKGAVILSPVVTAKNTPASGASDVFVVHEGTYVTIIDNTLKGWMQVRLEDGREGWMPSKDMEMIVKKQEKK